MEFFKQTNLSSFINLFNQKSNQELSTEQESGTEQRLLGLIKAIETKDVQKLVDELRKYEYNLPSKNRYSKAQSSQLEKTLAGFGQPIKSSFSSEFSLVGTFQVFDLLAERSAIELQFEPLYITMLLVGEIIKKPNLELIQQCFEALQAVPESNFQCIKFNEYLYHVCVSLIGIIYIVVGASDYLAHQKIPKIAEYLVNHHVFSTPDHPTSQTLVKAEATFFISKALMNLINSCFHPDLEPVWRYYWQETTDGPVSTYLDYNQNKSNIDQNSYLGSSSQSLLEAISTVLQIPDSLQVSKNYGYEMWQKVQNYLLVDDGVRQVLRSMCHLSWILQDLIPSQSRKQDLMDTIWSINIQMIDSSLQRQFRSPALKDLVPSQQVGLEIGGQDDTSPYLSTYHLETVVGPFLDILLNLLDRNAFTENSAYRSYLSASQNLHRLLDDAKFILAQTPQIETIAQSICPETNLKFGLEILESCEEYGLVAQTKLNIWARIIQNAVNLLRGNLSVLVDFLIELQSAHGNYLIVNMKSRDKALYQLLSLSRPDIAEIYQKVEENLTHIQSLMEELERLTNPRKATQPNLSGLVDIVQQTKFLFDQIESHLRFKQVLVTLRETLEKTIDTITQIEEFRQQIVQQFDQLGTYKNLVLDLVGTANQFYGTLSPRQPDTVTTAMQNLVKILPGHTSLN
jgi:hypothetical protein